MTISQKDRETFFAGHAADLPARHPMLRVAEPNLSGNERRYVLDCLDRNELSWLGAYVGRFERAFADFCHVKHAVACCNGTAALHLALLALGIRPGDDVFVPGLTYVATAAAVRYCGARPVLVDVLPDTWCLDPEALLRAARASRRPKAVIPVHLYGVPADMQRIGEVARATGMSVVEDAAEAHGALCHDWPAGAFGDLGCFSFYANKILTTGEGGMVTTQSATLAESLRLYRGQGQTRPYFHEVVGYNYRMTNLQAAIGLAQVERAHEHVAGRRRVVSWYREALRGVELQARPNYAVPSDWICVALLPDLSARFLAAERLKVAGIETRPVFVPLADLPPYSARPLPIAGMIADRGLCLPTHAGVTREDVDRIAGILERVVA